MKVRIHVCLAACAVTALVACGTPGAPVPPSLELPRPPLDLAATRKGGNVKLSWTPAARTTDGQNLRGKKLGPTLACRGINDFPMAKCAQIIGQAPPTLPPLPAKGKKTPPPAPRAEYTDRLPADLQQMYPAGFATYAVESMNWRWRSAGLSNQVKVPLAPTLPPPKELRAEVTANGVVISSGCSSPAAVTPALRFQCRLYRRQQDTQAAMAIQDVSSNAPPCEIPGSGSEASCHLTDRTVEWEKTYTYWVTPVTAVMQNDTKVAEVEGDDSPSVTVFAHDVFPPAVPGGLEAVASGVGQKPFIDLTWTPDTDADLAGYNVYRQALAGTGWEKLNGSLVTTPAFRDQNVVPGQTYTYAVTAADVRGNESARSQPAAESIP